MHQSQQPSTLTPPLTPTPPSSSSATHPDINPNLNSTSVPQSNIEYQPQQIPCARSHSSSSLLPSASHPHAHPHSFALHTNQIPRIPSSPPGSFRSACVPLPSTTAPSSPSPSPPHSHSHLHGSQSQPQSQSHGGSNASSPHSSMRIKRRVSHSALCPAPTKPLVPAHRKRPSIGRSTTEPGGGALSEDTSMYAGVDSGESDIWERSEHFENRLEKLRRTSHSGGLEGEWDVDICMPGVSADADDEEMGEAEGEAERDEEVMIGQMNRSLNVGDDTMELDEIMEDEVGGSPHGKSGLYTPSVHSPLRTSRLLLEDEFSESLTAALSHPPHDTNTNTIATSNGSGVSSPSRTPPRNRKGAPGAPPSSYAQHTGISDININTNTNIDARMPLRRRSRSRSNSASVGRIHSPLATTPPLLPNHLEPEHIDVSVNVETATATPPTISGSPFQPRLMPTRTTSQFHGVETPGSTTIAANHDRSLTSDPDSDFGPSCGDCSKCPVTIDNGHFECDRSLRMRHMQRKSGHAGRSDVGPGSGSTGSGIGAGKGKLTSSVCGLDLF